MSAAHTVQTDKATRLTLRLLDELFEGDAVCSVVVRLWDGTSKPNERGQSGLPMTRADWYA